MTLLKINRLLPIYISIVPLKFAVDIQSQSKVRVRKPKNSNMAASRPFWKWHRWKSIGFCLWPPSTCIWNLKLKFQSKLDFCSGNHVVYRQTDGQGNPVYPPSNFVGRWYNKSLIWQLRSWHIFPFPLVVTLEAVDLSCWVPACEVASHCDQCILPQPCHQPLLCQTEWFT